MASPRSGPGRTDDGVDARRLDRVPHRLTEHGHALHHSPHGPAQYSDWPSVPSASICWSGRHFVTVMFWWRGPGVHLSGAATTPPAQEAGAVAAPQHADCDGTAPRASATARLGGLGRRLGGDAGPFNPWTRPSAACVPGRWRPRHRRLARRHRVHDSLADYVAGNREDLTQHPPARTER